MSPESNVQSPTSAAQHPRADLDFGHWTLDLSLMLVTARRALLVRACRANKAPTQESAVLRQYLPS